MPKPFNSLFSLLCLTMGTTHSFSLFKNSEQTLEYALQPNGRLEVTAKHYGVFSSKESFDKNFFSEIIKPEAQISNYQGFVNDLGNHSLSEALGVTLTPQKEALMFVVPERETTVSFSVTNDRHSIHCNPRVTSISRGTR